MHLRRDWEMVVRAAIDFALSKPEIDPKRIVLVGWSFGGFLAPRAAAFEKRIAALIADPGQWDQRDVLKALPLKPDELAAFPDIDPKLLDPFEEWVRFSKADPMLRWRLVQRGLWAHGAKSIYEMLRRG
ncbi:MAG: alpha/beta fold hydrolase [Acidobacteriaceae bacterium]|nr:alpha/beta fold hydrolase [Acidobacteriaceae bacterium]